MLKFKIYQHLRDVLLICIIFPVLIFACKLKSSERFSKGASSLITTDKIKLFSLNDQPIDLSGYKGKSVFINFWATWCKPCLKEMPSIQKAMEVLNDENIVFLFASDETNDEIEQFKSNHDYPFNYVRLENPGEINIMALPTTFIFNPEGKLVFNEIGYRRWDDKNNIDLLLSIAKSK